MLYFLITILATSAGALTGMGGGVIIKPVLDLLGQYDAATIGLLSSVTVLAMAVVSLLRQARQKTDISAKTALPLALGAVFGGMLGEGLLKQIISLFNLNRTVIIIQNAVLAALILIIFIYMPRKDRIKSLGFNGLHIYLIIGLTLGIISSFLGIGGGPINVALLVFICSFEMKTAAYYSIFIILFAQISKLTSIALSTGFSSYDFTVLPAMVAGGISGGFIGSMLSKKIPEKALTMAFNGIQLVVLGFCIINTLY